MKKFFVSISSRQVMMSLLLVTFFSGFLSLNTHAQSIPDSISKADMPTPAILAHYTLEELEEIKSVDPLKYQSIFYYYTRSYLIETFDCNDCVPQHDFSHFDVFKYESYRQQSARATLSFEKYGYRLILLSIDELIYTLPIHHQ